MTTGPTLKARILVVDDEPTTRNAVAYALTLTDYETLAVGTGGEALSALASRDFDLMLLDLRMPGMDGTEVLVRARQAHPGLVVVVLTAYATPSSVAYVLQAGAADCLQKPCSLEEIETAVSAALGRARQASTQSQEADPDHGPAGSGASRLECNPASSLPGHATLAKV